MKRIGGAASDLTIESDNNKVSVSSHGGMRGTDLTIQTPGSTHL